MKKVKGPALRFAIGRATRLRLRQFHGCGAFLVVIAHGIDPSADGITPHQPGIAEQAILSFQIMKPQ